MNAEFNRLELYILFDDMFYLYMYGNLDFAKDKAEETMGEHNFTKAQIFTKSDDTMLMTIE